MSRLVRLIHEIHRRSLWQILLLYLGTSWAVLEAVDHVVARFGMPPWVYGSATILLLIGLPIVVATAFVQEGLPGEARESASAPPIATTAAPSSSATTPFQEANESPRATSGVLTWRRAIASGVLAFAAWGVVAAVWTLTVDGSRAPAEIDAAAGALAELGATDESRQGLLLVRTQPDDAAIALLAERGADAPNRSFEAGISPLRARLPSGEYLIRISRGGDVVLDLRARVESGQQTEIDAHLPPDEDWARNLVVVPEGRSPIAEDGLIVPAFLIGRHEVTNQEYLEFVAAGGYDDEGLWPTSMWLEGRTTPRQQALASFVDRTGVRAPRGWSGGVFPQGESDHPVVGVSWYEADAFARWSGRELPTRHQWWRAAIGDGAAPFPWGTDVAAIERRANFALDGTTPVGSRPFGVSPFGAHDVAGNVREWLREDEAGRRVAAGGSWQDPSYVFDPTWIEPFDPGFAAATIGFRCVRELPAGALATPTTTLPTLPPRVALQ